MVKKMTILMPDDLHRQLKETSFRKGSTMARIIIRAIKKSRDLFPKQDRAKTKVEKTTSICKDDDGERFFTRIPAHVAEKLRLTEEHYLYLNRMEMKISKKKTIRITASKPGSSGPEGSLMGYVRSGKDGTLLASLPSDVAKKLRLDREGGKLRWTILIPKVRLEFVDEEEK